MKSTPRLASLAARLLLLTGSLVWLSACGSDGTTTATQPPDVYAVGFIVQGNLYKAVLWKNDVMTLLDSGIYGARAFSVAVANGNVYVAGFEGSPTGNDVAVLWTNGVPTQLTSDADIAIAYAVGVSGTDVYVAASDTKINGSVYQSAAIYWKNSVMTTLPDSGMGAVPSAITFDGTDVYITGNVQKQTQTGPSSYTTEPVASYWKNGVLTSLTDGLNFAQAANITVQAGHVYVAGSTCATLTPDCSVATYWKDGAATTLQPATFSEASDIAVSGSNIYISDNVDASAFQSSGNLAVLVTNGSPVELSTDTQAAANCVIVYNGDIYVGGAFGATAAYWRNGAGAQLNGATSNSSVYAMTVVPAGT